MEKNGDKKRTKIKLKTLVKGKILELVTIPNAVRSC